MKKGRRKYPRFYLNVEGTILLKESPKVEHPCVVKDISQRACMIIAKTYLKKGDIFSLVFRYDDDEYRFRCRVIRTINIAKEIGAEFIDYDEFSMRRLFYKLSKKGLGL